MSSEYNFNTYGGYPDDDYTYDPDFVSPDDYDIDYMGRPDDDYLDDDSLESDFEDYIDHADFPDAYAYDEEPEPLTYEQIRQIVRDERERIDKESWADEDIIDRAVQRTAQAMEAHYAQREAPAARRELVEDLTVGLGPQAKRYLDEYLTGYTPDVFTAIRADQKTMDMLRRAAEYENARASSPRPSPLTEQVYGVNDYYDENFERSIDAMWRGGFNTVPGLTKERFREEMKRRVS